MGGLSIIRAEGQESWKTALSKGFLDRFFANSPDGAELAQNKLIELFDAIEIGHSCIPLSPSELPQLGHLVGHEKAPLVFDQGLLFFSRYHLLEVRLAQDIKRLCEAESTYRYNLDSYLHLLNDEHQQKTLSVVSENNLTIVTGGAGTGKTYTLARMIAAMHAQTPQAKITLAAPTGKASQRMQEALLKAFADPELAEHGLVSDVLRALTPTTIHRLLGMNFNGAVLYHGEMQFEADILVIDEVSMLDLRLATLLFAAIKSGAKVILLGDAKQLSSVDVGHVLADLQASALLENSVIRLENSRRFHASANIGQLAAFVQQQHRNGDFSVLHGLRRYVQPCDQLEAIEPAPIQNDLVRYCKINGQACNYLDALFLGYHDYLSRLMGYYSGERNDTQLARVIQAFDSYRILTATKHGDFGLHAINRHFKTLTMELLGLRNGVGEWYLGRPVLITQNDYRLGLSNGDIGICLYHRMNHGEFEVFFPQANKWVSTNQLPSSIQTAYALTIHKSQGSEFEHVAIVLDQSSERLLSQELLYTAITRAKKVVSLLVDERSLVSAITTKTVRSSGLALRLS